MTTFETRSQVYQPKKAQKIKPTDWAKKRNIMVNTFIPSIKKGVQYENITGKLIIKKDKYIVIEYNKKMYKYTKRNNGKFLLVTEIWGTKCEIDPKSIY